MIQGYSDWMEYQANVLFANVAGFEARTLQRIGKRIDKYGRLSLADIKTINNIAAVKEDMDAIIKDLADMTGKNIREIYDIYGQAIARMHEENRPLYDHRGKKFVPFSENRELQALVRAYAKTTGGTMLNLAKTKMLGFTDKSGNFSHLQRAYTNVLDKAVMAVSTGTSDFHTAMRDSIIELGGSGLRTRVQYDTVTRRLDSVVRQHLLWGAKQASNEYNEMIGDELGCDGIEIDWHSNPRPSHEFMQGKQYALGGARKINGVLFEDATPALEALHDYGCLHYKVSIICGISEPRYSPEELKRLNERNSRTYDINGKQMTGYEASQAMRGLEREVRKQKDIRELARASGDKVTVKNCNERIKALKAKYTEISQITGIPEEPRRMSKVRMPKESGGSGGSGATRVLTNSGDGGIIREKEHFISSSEYAVKKGLLTSREFISKIQSLTDDADLQREYYSEVKQMLEHRSGTNGEDLKFYNPRLKKWYRSTTGTLAGTPEYNDEILLAIKEALPNELIAFHNHPAGMPPSADDLNAALGNKYSRGYTIGHNGVIFEYSPPKYEIPEIIYIGRIGKYMDSDISIFEAQIKALDELKVLYKFEYREVIRDA